jgi:hypothetical protein
MINAPNTKAEARRHRYSRWAGNPKGNSFREEQCAFEQFKNIFGVQCTRRPGHGPDGLYCKQHAKKIAEREAR